MFERFIYEGFNPTKDLQTYAQKMFWLIDAEAPSDSTAKAEIVKTEDGYEGFLQFSSLAGQFKAHVTGHDPKRVVMHLCDQVRGQFSKWKETRFEPVVCH